MSDRYECDRCGACCRHLIIEIEHIDVVREPRLLTVAELLDGNGRFTFESEWDKQYNLASGPIRPCPFVGSDNLCAIYPTRPNICILFEAGEEQCQRARGAAGLPALMPVTEPGDLVGTLQRYSK